VLVRRGQKKKEREEIGQRGDRREKKYETPIRVEEIGEH
jgi:hypothetical protein